MANVQIAYAGEYYSIVDRGIDDVQQEITAIVASGIPGWIEAFDGHGSREPYRLLITSASHLSLTTVATDPEDLLDDDDWNSVPDSPSQ